MVKYYLPSLRQVEDWHIAYTIRKKMSPNLMRFQVELPADIDLRVFEKAYSCLVERHESLRTCFPVVGGEIVQRVDPFHPDRFGLSFINCDDADKLEQINYELSAAFKNLKENALSKGILVHTRGRRYFVFLIHHILSDFWSINILRREFNEIYVEFMNGGNYTAGSGNLQLGEYFGKRREAAEARHQEAIEYWLHKLSAKEWHVSYNSVYSRVLGKARSESGVEYVRRCERLHQAYLLRKSRGQQYLVCMDKAILDRLNDLDREKKITKYAVLFSCLMLAGFIVSGNESILIRSHFNSRQEAESEGVVGNLLGMVLLYGEIDVELTVEQFISRCYKRFLESSDHIIYNSERLNILQIGTRCFSHFNFIDRESMGNQAMEIHEPIVQANNRVVSPLFCVATEFTNTIAFKWGYHLLFYNFEVVERISILYFRLLDKMICNFNENLKAVIRDDVNF